MRNRDADRLPRTCWPAPAARAGDNGAVLPPQDPAPPPRVQQDLLHPDRTNAKGHAVTASGANHNGGSHMDNDTLCTCGYPNGTFACKIRHVQLNTGDAKAEND